MCSADRVQRLEAIRSRRITLERIVDATQRSALIAELEVQIQSLAKQKQTHVEAVEQATNIKKWFTNVRDALDKQSSNSVSNHVNAFGPLASLIQKRLHAVFGFGDVSLIA